MFQRENLLAAVAVFIIRLLLLTMRVRLEDRSGMSRNESPGGHILCFWHNRILGISLAFLRNYPASRRGVTVLTSPSRDGEILARIMGRLGMGAVRGSSSRRGSRALLEMVRLVEEGYDIAITPDGPRGPCYHLGPGAILLAQATGAPLLAVHAKYSRCLRIKSWDRFIIPLPFSSVTVFVDPAITVPKNTTNEEFEAIRARFEAQLRARAE